MSADVFKFDEVADLVTIYFLLLSNEKYEIHVEKNTSINYAQINRLFTFYAQLLDIQRFLGEKKNINHLWNDFVDYTCCLRCQNKIVFNTNS